MKNTGSSLLTGGWRSEGMILRETKLALQLIHILFYHVRESLKGCVNRMQLGCYIVCRIALFALPSGFDGLLPHLWLLVYLHELSVPVLLY